MQSRTEAFITQFAAAIAKNESSEPGVVKAEIIEDLSRTLARAAARAISRRTQPMVSENRAARMQEEMEVLEE